jgi:hypothetical protein
MTLKEKIINEFLNDETKNFTLFQLTYSRMAEMYDQIVQVVKNKENFQRFLNFEGAITPEGRVKFDKKVTYFDKELKKDITTKIAFKFPIYNFIYSKYRTAIYDIAEYQKKIPLPTN